MRKHTENELVLLRDGRVLVRVWVKVGWVGMEGEQCVRVRARASARLRVRVHICACECARVSR